MAIAWDRLPIGLLLLRIAFRFGGYCSGYGSDLEAITLDRVPIRMLLLGIGFRLRCYRLGSASDCKVIA